MFTRRTHGAFALLLTELGELVFLHLVRRKVSNKFKEGAPRHGAEVEVMRKELAKARDSRHICRHRMVCTDQ
jgi:hypothetical protein